ncbi:MAG: L-aspartate oxidase [Planctomycetes bacterium]|nr:L-aspartate oxidase [Planctomycetota bacterium]MCH9723678.1 L-aspartate oxidase [Planctomycetota bacterium]MCH9778496.1 L-aspartate oxidase [Planctomycetota bacterium]MCH9791110.1 L-aspartate oxidase [Planctomycetota bacterium]
MDPIQIESGQRYLTRINPKRIPHIFTDVLIIGGGIAGSRAALQIDPRLETIIVNKGKVTQSNSAYAQGGIAGVLDPLDDISNHIEDTLAAGKDLCNRELVEHVCQEAPRHIRELIEYGADFDKQDGKLALTKEGGHSHRRVAHALGDATGKELMRALVSAVENRPSIQTWTKTPTLDLVTEEGKCRGAIIWNRYHGKTLIWAKQVILATGGAGCLFRETTNPALATGDGHALAFRAGALLQDMEFMQFHPTVLYIAGGARYLVSEAVRGEGAYLRDSNGVRFMSEYHPDLELAHRDVVSRAITDRMLKTNHSCVYLDLTHLKRSLIRERFPNISEVCASFGLDLSKDQIPVRPGAHYMIGGVKTDLEARTSVPHLWAAGEVTSSGLHGSNRLASNSLLEGLIFGAAAGKGASAAALSQPDQFSASLLPEWDSEKGSDEDLDSDDLRNSLASLMWRDVGITRSAESLKDAKEKVDFWSRYVVNREFKTLSGWELQNMLLVAQLMIASAIERRESRGVHYRSDFPETDAAFQKHISVIANS